MREIVKSLAKHLKDALFYEVYFKYEVLCHGYYFATGVFSDWSAWGQCSQTCGGGVKLRNRSCLGGSDCEGSTTEVQECNTDSCELLDTTRKT